jgi:Protein of unknown function (DUF2933)
VSHCAKEIPRTGAPPAPWWRTRSAIALCGFLLIAGVYLLTEHTAHAYAALPFVLLLSCPLMHLFMHHGHGGHRGSDAGPPSGREADHDDLVATRPPAGR